MYNILDEIRFKTKIIKLAGCWIWTGSLRKDLYGRFRLNKKTILAHRFSWEIYNRRSPGSKLVLHKCDIECCVNPDHLYLGTPEDNMRDRQERGDQNNQQYWFKKGNTTGRLCAGIKKPHSK